MKDGQDTGTSAALTVDTAAAAIEGLLSTDEAQQPDEAPAPAVEVTDEAPDDVDEAEPTTESDESDEASASEDDDAASDESDDDEPAPKAPRTFRVKVDGQDMDVAEDELLRGYSRTADYTRKTQQLAEERRTFQGESDAVRVERQQYATALQQLTDALAQMQPAEPDWDKLRTENPNQYAATWAAWQQHRQEQDALNAERDRALARVATDQQRALVEQLEGERAKLVDAIPAWKDAATATSEKTAIADYARQLGYSDDDLRQVYDHRLMVMLRKAMLFDRGEQTRATARPIVQQRIEAAKVPKPGPAASTKRKVTETARANMRLAKTGRVEDAAGVILTMLGE